MVDKVIENWDDNAADKTDVLVALIRGFIPRRADKDAATKAIYSHVRDAVDERLQPGRRDVTMREVVAGQRIKIAEDRANAAERLAYSLLHTKYG